MSTNVQVVPVAPPPVNPDAVKEAWTSLKLKTSTSRTGQARLSSTQGCKLPYCAYYIALRRVNHFTKFAVIAAIGTLILAGVKYWLALQGEKEANQTSLADSARSLTQALRLKMHNDFGTLDAIANLWHLDSKLSREHFRKYVLSDYFQARENGMSTIMLMHRILPQQLDTVETNNDSIRVRNECCDGTRYDIPSQRSLCRNWAKNLCKVPGPPRFHVSQMSFPGGVKKVSPADRNSSEYVVVMNQEPLEINPGPLGLDLLTVPGRDQGWLESDKSGRKGMTKRLKRVYSTKAEFGMLVWNNVFIDQDVDAGKLIEDGVSLMTKQQILNQGGKPWSIGSVVAVYRIQDLMSEVVGSVFGAELADTQVMLFDERETTKETERLLSLYDTYKSLDESADAVMEFKDMTKAELTAHPMTQINRFTIPDTDVQFSVAVIPHENFSQKRRSAYPVTILVISLLLILGAQLERWLGHPTIVSEMNFVRAKVEREIRLQLEDEIQAAARIESMNAAKVEYTQVMSA